ncbi:hypothetical protein PIB30_069059 [Stylosanthes scabra]|uniref:C2 domain-containing protein n=1 Tax=Stylosanthes scabra TaxID=79078 RepID=A0ABU6RN19_9FABA|nr:hypothetical protein [Stylosanthes scabra]
MDSFNEGHQSSSFRYNPNLNMENHAAGHDNDDDDDEAGEFSGVLEIFVHHARNIHNICIYDNQDVYAKFSFTYNPDETLSTRIINGGGKNPTFNENLRMKISNVDDAVLKCEIWMFSRARNHLEDQLLGFSLVPISQVLIGKGKGKVTQDYSLSSTDLFHSPAGTVQLTLSLDTNNSNVDFVSESAKSSSISSEVVLLDRKATEPMLAPVEYSRIEFPDIGAAKENQEMATEYFNSCSSRGLLLPFLRLGAINDCEMNPVSPNESIHQNSGFLSSTTTSLSDDRDRNSSADSIQKKNNSSNVSITVLEGSVSNSPDTPTSKKEGESIEEKEGEKSDDGEKKVGDFGQVFSAPLVNMNMNLNLEAEQSAMQKQIVDMYMRSMQQFTESLARMKLPMEIDKSERKDQDCGDVIQNHESSKNNNSSISEIDDISNNNNNSKKKKDGSRVFYGSRAFF